MTIEIKVPAMGESVTEATISKWFKKEGDAVKRDEPLLELETDKVTVEVPSPADGAIESISVQAGATVAVGALLGAIAEGQAGAATNKAGSAAKPAAPKAEAPKPAATPAPAAAPAAPAPKAPSTTADAQKSETLAMPSAKRISEESGIALSSVAGTGKDGRVTKGDMLGALEARSHAPAPAAVAPSPISSGPRGNEAREERVPMTRLRKTVALRLKESQNTAAMLTTFNEVDMSAVMSLRSTYKDTFEKKHGVKLGFMGFFTKAVVAALKELPNVNAEIEGDNIVYKNYYDIGIAVSTERGLVVPVVKGADQLSLAGIEKAIADFGARARDNKLKLEDLQGGTFSITNGGVFGSLMSTPILNSPQSGILGMHKIQPRPMAVGDKIEIRPMMYLALSYDHRIVDGREAVTFLVKIKENLEDPQRMLLEV
jgi:2-oxoglutarate dehydrogenase E2 component (dihydrolipoamide succinyltransferase)